MNKFKIIIIMLIMSIIFCSFGSAAEQSVKIKTEYFEENIINNETVGVWKEYPTNNQIMLLNDIIEKDGGTKIIELVEIDEEMAIFNVIIDGQLTPNLKLNKWESKEIEDLKITNLPNLNNIIETDNEIPVKVWLEPNENDKKYLTVNGINSFNPIEYGSDSGWTTTYEKEEVILFVERTNTNKIVTFEMESENAYEKEFVNKNLIKYYLKNNGNYKFSTKYLNEGAWGGESDVTDTYMISITGLGETTSNDISNGNGNTGTTNNNDASGSVPIVEGNYDVVLGNTKNIITDEDGEWTVGNGMNVDVNIQGGKYVWTFDFTEAGRYSPSFVSENGKEGHINFNVKDTSVNANQVPANEDNSSNIGLIILILGILAGIAVVGNTMMKGNKNKKNIANIVNNNEENEGGI